jgi:hypothetical protein
LFYFRKFEPCTCFIFLLFLLLNRPPQLDMQFFGKTLVSAVLLTPYSASHERPSSQLQMLMNTFPLMPSGLNSGSSLLRIWTMRFERFRLCSLSLPVDFLRLECLVFTSLLKWPLCLT